MADGGASAVGDERRPSCLDGRDDWRWQLRHAVTTSAGLARWLDLSPGERAGVDHAARGGLPLRVTPYVLSLLDRADPSCPLRRQFVPTAEEAVTVAGDLCDPLGERDHEVAPRLVRRYPDRALLLLSDQCAAHCRFCTRREWVARGRAKPSWQALAPALEYLRQEHSVREVILSGGDPLLLGTNKLARLVAALRRIDHIQTLRLATRVPSVLPQRVTRELCDRLRELHPIWVMTHFNHPAELTVEASAACRRLVDAGFPLMNQTVLLAGINDRAEVLEALFRRLISWRVRPYYLLQADPARGTGHLRTPLAAGVALMASLQGRLSGIALPKLVVDTPGGLGKVPVGPETVVARSSGRTRLRTFRGVDVEYVDPPTVP
ncbi:MAG: KamA family radical SAM protein [Deltaproteobacteria bacterium]|jgi:lysine 2,3-aminomutase|nr:KamA family radical SAM protein [Deltaproteobacteria bacterium]MBW2530776.1 KamA family radical SAM protein [Deltaproteobacteria bacterium]